MTEPTETPRGEPEKQARKAALTRELVGTVAHINQLPADEKIEAARELSLHELPEFRMEGLYQFAKALLDCNAEPSKIVEHLEEARRLAIELEHFGLASEAENLRGDVLKTRLFRISEAEEAFALAGEYREEIGKRPVRWFETPDPGHD